MLDARVEGEGHDRQDRQGQAGQSHRRAEEALLWRIRTCKRVIFLNFFTNNIVCFCISLLFINVHYIFLKDFR